MVFPMGVPDVWIGDEVGGMSCLPFDCGLVGISRLCYFFWWFGILRCGVCVVLGWVDKVGQALKYTA